jgi:hypothetical protein
MLKEVSCLCGKTSGVAEFHKQTVIPGACPSYFLHHFEYLCGNFGMTTRDDGRWDILCGVCYTPLRETPTATKLGEHLHAIPAGALELVSAEE